MAAPGAVWDVPTQMDVPAQMKSKAQKDTIQAKYAPTTSPSASAPPPGAIWNVATDTASPIQRMAAEEEDNEPTQAKLAEPTTAAPIQQMAAADDDDEAPTQAKLAPNASLYPIQRMAEEDEEAPAQAKFATTGTLGPLQRKMSDDDDEAPMQAKLGPNASLYPIQRMAEEDEEAPTQAKFVNTEMLRPLQRKMADDDDDDEAPMQAKTASTASQYAASPTASPATSMPTGIQAQMEHSFGTDFSGVNIHANSTKATHLSALAYTQGQDIHFAPGQYQPTTSQGQELLGHELTHVVQQREGRVSATRRAKGMPINDDAHLEHEADVMGKKAAQTKLPASSQRQPATSASANTTSSQQPASTSQGNAVKPTPAPRKPAPALSAMTEQMPQSVVPSAAASTPEQASSASQKAKEDSKKKEDSSVLLHRFLTDKSLHVLDEANTKTANLAHNAKQHDSAATLRLQSEKAVEPPAADLQSRSNATVTEAVDDKPTPKPQKAAATNTLNSALNSAVPKTLEELDDFKEQGKARDVGTGVLDVVRQETGPVADTYQAMEQTPPPQELAAKPKPIPTAAPARRTSAMHLGAHMFPALPKDYTDQSEHTTRVDKTVQQEGLTEKQMAMVDSGPLHQAQKERTSLKKKVTEAPQQMQGMVQQRAQGVQQTMAKEEGQTKAAMLQNRHASLGQTLSKQQGNKTAQEAKRKEIGDKINGFYETARQNVTHKLQKLEKDSLKKFAEGQANASKAFENEVNTKIKAWKKKRYANIGVLRWPTDKLFGLDDHPAVKSFFDEAQANFKSAIDGLINNIMADAQAVIVECKAEVTKARDNIQKYVSELAPGLRAIGQQAMRAMEEKLNALDSTIDAKRKGLVKQLAKKREEAIQKIGEKAKEMQKALGGLTDRATSLLAAGAKKFFVWGLKKLGVDPKVVLNFLGKVESTVMQIVRHPGEFIANLALGIQTGLNNFMTNIGTHLRTGLVSWLTGAMAAVPIVMPETFDLKGVMHLVLQVLGLTWENFRAKLVKRLGEKRVSRMEKTVGIVKRVMTEGPIALWNILKEKAAEVKQAVMEKLRNWIVTRLITAAIIKIMSYLNPATAILDAIHSIYKAIMFLIDNKDRIVDLFKTIVGGIADVAYKRLGPFVEKIETTLSMILPMIFDFMARLIGLDGIADKIQEILKAVSSPVQDAMQKAVGWVVKKAKKGYKKSKAAVKKGTKKVKKLYEKGKATVEEGVKKLAAWWNKKYRFKNAAGENHSLFFEDSNSQEGIMIASTKQPLKHYTERLKQELDTVRGNNPKDPFFTQFPGGINAFQQVFKDIIDIQKNVKSFKDKWDYEGGLLTTSEGPSGKSKTAANKAIITLTKIKNLSRAKATLRANREKYGIAIANGLKSLSKILALLPTQDFLSLIGKNNSLVTSKRSVRPQSEIDYSKTQKTDILEYYYSPTNLFSKTGQIYPGPKKRSVDGLVAKAKLSINPGNEVGFPPNENSELFRAIKFGQTSSKALKKRTPKSTTHRIHLINHNLHGKGKKENLAPGEKRINDGMKPHEEKIKKAVFEQNRVMYYKVQVIYKHGINVNPITVHGNGAQAQALQQPYIDQAEVKGMLLEWQEMCPTVPFGSNGQKDIANWTRKGSVFSATVK